MAFKAGLRSTKFAVKISENPPKDKANLFEKAYNAMNVEEKFKEFKAPNNLSYQKKNSKAKKDSKILSKKIKQKKIWNYKSHYLRLNL